jgi:hypothetical protein
VAAQQLIGLRPAHAGARRRSAATDRWRRTKVRAGRTLKAALGTNVWTIARWAKNCVQVDAVTISVIGQTEASAMLRKITRRFGGELASHRQIHAEAGQDEKNAHAPSAHRARDACDPLGGRWGGLRSPDG